MRFVPTTGTAAALSELIGDCRETVNKGPDRVLNEARTHHGDLHREASSRSLPQAWPDHSHKHGPNCGHTAIRHDGHVDYLHDGHLHHMHEDHVDEHVIAVNAANPVKCTPQVTCSHVHGPDCGHEAVPHGDHLDYLVDGRLHHPHSDHCDDHGPVQLA